MINKVICGICEKENNSMSGLGRHVSLSHGMDKKEYYIKYLKKNKKEHQCKICNKETTFRSWAIGFLDYCSTKCANLDPKIKEKAQNTYFKKTGYKWNSQNPKSVEKSKETCLKKYGVEYGIIGEQAKEKSKETCLKKYGVEYSFQSDNNKEKTKRTVLKKYGVDNVSKNEIIKNRISESNTKNKEKLFIKNILPKGYTLINYNLKDNIILKCPKGHVFECQKQLILKRQKAKHNCCIKCTPLNSFENKTSKFEKEIFKFIKDNYEKEIIENSQEIISPLELDIYLPDLKLAFEFNGLYWHSELYKDKKYHVNKIEKCEYNGIHLIHIYEDDWVYKKEIVKSRILNLIHKNSANFYARECYIEEVSSKRTKEFLNNNHIQGSIGSSVNIGLYYKHEYMISPELVCLMAFGKGRFKNKHTELLRFCNKQGYSVVGGASKLLKHFIKIYNPKEIISYADRDWSYKENFYDKLKFTKVNKTPPNYFYIVNGIKTNRFKYRKSELVKKGYSKEMTEHEIMLKNKIYRIYDSGNWKYSLKV